MFYWLPTKSLFYTKKFRCTCWNKTKFRHKKIKIFLLHLISAYLAWMAEWYHSQPVWPDLAKFRHFGNNLAVFGKFWVVYFLFGKMLNLLWRIFYIFGLIFIVENGQILKNYLTIWSHCTQLWASVCCALVHDFLPQLWRVCYRITA